MKFTLARALTLAGLLAMSASQAHALDLIYYILGMKH